MPTTLHNMILGKGEYFSLVGQGHYELNLVS